MFKQITSESVEMETQQSRLFNVRLRQNSFFAST